MLSRVWYHSRSVISYRTLWLQWHSAWCYGIVDRRSRRRGTYLSLLIGKPLTSILYGHDRTNRIINNVIIFCVERFVLSMYDPAYIPVILRWRLHSGLLVSSNSWQSVLLESYLIGNTLDLFALSVCGPTKLSLRRLSRHCLWETWVLQLSFILLSHTRSAVNTNSLLATLNSRQALKGEGVHGDLSTTDDTTTSTQMSTVSELTVISVYTVSDSRASLWET